MSLIREHLNSVKLETQKKSIFVCRAARDTKDVRYQNSKSNYLFLNLNTILLYITMTKTINNSISANKAMSLCASLSNASMHTPPTALKQPKNTPAIARFLGPAMMGRMGTCFTSVAI